jgi:hypothetical protein
MTMMVSAQNSPPTADPKHSTDPRVSLCIAVGLRPPRVVCLQLL